jgi:hypothetical protein
MNLSYHNTPFPHIVGSLDEELYSMVLESWDDLNSTEKTYNVAAGNRSNIELKSEKIKQVLSSLSFHLHSKFVDAYLESYPKLLNINEFRLNCRILYSENKPSEEGYKIRGWHLDSGDKFLVGLWYFKHPEEEDDGGDLLLMNPTTKEFKTVKYEKNMFIIFPNTLNSWHAVSPRKSSKFPRRYINILVESPEITLHNYRRSGTSVDDEFRGKLINYYK